MEDIQLLKKIINQSEYLVFLGGAGVSTESGIPVVFGLPGWQGSPLLGGKGKCSMGTVNRHAILVISQKVFGGEDGWAPSCWIRSARQDGSPHRVGAFATIFSVPQSGYREEVFWTAPH